MKQAHDWMDKFKKNLLHVLGSSEKPSVKYVSISPVFMKLFPKMSDTKVVSRMKWVKTERK